MKKILVIDDDVDLLTSLSSMLKKYGYEVKGVSDVHEITNTVKAFHPNLIILDIRLDNYDGRDVCREIKLNGNNTDTKVILFSAHHDEDDFREYGADDFIRKPFRFTSLVEKINAQLN